MIRRCDPMNISEEQRNYILTLSLKSISLIKLTTTLWNQVDIRHLVVAFSFPLLQSERWQKWQEIEDKVIEKVPRLPLPEHFKREILGFIKPIGAQILIWILFHKKLLSEGYVKKNFSLLCWIPQGIVDRKKTAEGLLKDRNLNIIKRYQLACIYCLEDNIRELWCALPKRKKAAFYNNGNPSFRGKHELVVFWTYNIIGELHKLNKLIKQNKFKEMSPYQFAFEYAAESGNLAATEYFLQKLTLSEREESLVEYAARAARKRIWSFDNHIPQFADVLLFLLSEMNNEQQIKVFRKYPYEVLRCFLDKPWQEFFIETANRMWDFISIYNFTEFLVKIVGKIKNGYKDYDYPALFEAIWQQSSKKHKEYVIDKGTTSTMLLSKLFKVKDKKNVSLILKDATLKQKEKIIFCSYNMDLCESLAYDNEWDLLKFFINECISSKEKVIKLRQEFRKRMEAYPGSRRSEEKLEKEDWNKIFHLLDDLIQKDDKKRGVEEDNDDLGKRMCNSISK